MSFLQNERIRRHALLETIGALHPLDRALFDLDAQMRLASIEALRLATRPANLRRSISVWLLRSSENIRPRSMPRRSPSPRHSSRCWIRSAPVRPGPDVGQSQSSGPDEAARDEFKRIAELARAGSTTAIQQLQGAGEAFISQMERFGASPGGAAARIEVQSVIESVMADISQAQREASAGRRGYDPPGIAASGRHLARIDRRRDADSRIEEIKRLRR